MRAVTWQAKRKIAVKDVPDPEIQTDSDAIIKVTSSAICGSDLHLYEVMTPFMESRRHYGARTDGHRRRGGQRGNERETWRPGSGAI
jgi:threonine dehydrogenase-like Zn-dependent dehydrogenase